MTNRPFAKSISLPELWLSGTYPVGDAVLPRHLMDLAIVTEEETLQRRGAEDIRCLEILWLFLKNFHH